MIWKPMLIGFGFWVAVMLTALVAKGQETQSSDGLMKQVEPLKIYGTLLTEKSLIKYWDEWVDSCWADSTVKRVHHPGGIGDPCLVDWDCLVGSHYWNETFHRDPNDLKGFMEFIKRRTK
jgi:hypothetical protein